MGTTNRQTGGGHQPLHIYTQTSPSRSMRCRLQSWWSQQPHVLCHFTRFQNPKHLAILGLVTHRTSVRDHVRAAPSQLQAQISRCRFASAAKTLLRSNTTEVSNKKYTQQHVVKSTLLSRSDCHGRTIWVQGNRKIRVRSTRLPYRCLLGAMLLNSIPGNVSGARLSTSILSITIQSSIQW